MRLPWLMKKTRPDDLPEAIDTQTLPAPEPEPAHDEEVAETVGQEEQAGHTPQPSAKKTNGWFTPTRVMVAVASLPSLLSLILMVSTAMDISGGAAGLAAGLFYDAIVIVLVAIAWFQPAVRTLAGRGAWAGAVLASAVIVWHYDSEQMLWAVVPLGAKFAWHLALAALTAQQNVQATHRALAAEKERARIQRERVAAEAEQVRKDEEASADDDSLTVAQRREIAALRREAAFAKAKADAEAERERARIEAENTVAMSTDKAEADRLRARYELAAQVGGRLPLQVLAQFLPDLPGVEVTEVHRDRSQINAAPAANGAAAPIPAGFGAGLTQARNGIGGIGVDLGGRTAPKGSNGTGGTAPSQAHHAARRASGQATRQRVLAAIEEHGRDISTNRLAGLLGLGRTTVRDHRRALAEAGKHVMPDPKK